MCSPCGSSTAATSRGSHGRSSARPGTSAGATSTTCTTHHGSSCVRPTRSRSRSTATPSAIIDGCRSTWHARRSGSSRRVGYDRRSVSCTHHPDGRPLMTADLSPIAPHGGSLVNLLVTGAAGEALIEEAANLPSLTIDERELSDLEMLATGALSPLTGFQSEADYHSILDTMHLADGLAWAIPVVLGVDDDDLHRIGGRPAAAAPPPAARPRPPPRPPPRRLPRPLRNRGH